MVIVSHKKRERETERAYKEIYVRLNLCRTLKTKNNFTLLFIQFKQNSFKDTHFLTFEVDRQLQKQQKEQSKKFVNSYTNWGTGKGEYLYFLHYYFLAFLIDLYFWVQIFFCVYSFTCYGFIFVLQFSLFLFFSCFNLYNDEARNKTLARVY